MRIGVLTFSYTNFQPFQERLSRTGFYSVNVGDNMQTLAVRSLYERLGMTEPLLPVDRDTLAAYGGEPVIVPMNGCFYDWCFPLPRNVIPVFIGFQAQEGVIARNVEQFRNRGTIGCRDVVTAQVMRSHGIDAVVTGCLTLTLPRRSNPPKKPKLYIAYGSGSGALPASILKHVPHDLLDTAELVNQRVVAHRFPLGVQEMQAMEDYAQALLTTYRERASLVLTPLHHAATPCLASGIPVVLARKQDDARFSFIRSLMPVYLPDRFPDISWSPKLPDIAELQNHLVSRFSMMLSEALSGRTQQPQP